MRSLLALSLLALAPLAASAQGKKDKDKDEKPLPVVDLKRTEAVNYVEVHKILMKRCAACHSGPIKESRLDISSYEAVVKGGKRGSPVVPGKGDGSLLYKVMLRTAKPQMPPIGEGEVSPQDVALVKLWIDQGAKGPTGAIAPEKIIVGVPPANVTPIRAVAVSHD